MVRAVRRGPMLFWLILMGVGVLGAVGPDTGHAAGGELIVGLHPNRPARSLIVDHEPLAAHLRQTLDRPVKLISAKTSTAFAHRMLRGDYELALAPAHFARLVQVDRNQVPLARFRHDIPVLLVTRRDASDGAVERLRDKVLAIPDDALLSTLAGERWLGQQALQRDRDYRPLVTGSYASALHAVTNGKAAMTLSTPVGMKQTRADILKQVRVIDEITTIPPLVFVAREDVSAAQQQALQRALVSYRAGGTYPVVALADGELERMDSYLPETRRRLQASTRR